MESAKTPSKSHRIKHQDMSKTVGEMIDEVASSGMKQPTAAPRSYGFSASSDGPFSQNAPIMPDDTNVSWPMPIERFQYGHFLKPGDIILTTRMESFFAFLSRAFDNSRFAHSAITFITPQHYPAVEQSYVIEATFGGIDLNAFSEFLTPSKIFAGAKRKPRYIVGIKRLETDWFTDQMRPMVGARMLRFIKDDNYNFSLLAELAIGRSKLLARLRNLIFGRTPTISDYLKKSKKYAPDEFICSGFVQFAYVDMIRSAVEEGLLSPHNAPAAHNDVLFAPWIRTESTMEELMAVKPLELAGTPRLKWKYLIYDGMVHKVESEQQVNDLYDKVNADKRPWYKP